MGCGVIIAVNKWEVESKEISEAVNIHETKNIDGWAIVKIAYPVRYEKILWYK